MANMPSWLGMLVFNELTSKVTNRAPSGMLPNFFFLLYIFYLPFLYNIYTAPWKGEGSKPFIRGLQQIFIHSMKYSKKDKDVTR